MRHIINTMWHAAFTGVCHQSTDFHFPDIDVQLGKIQECALIRNVERADVEMNASLCSSSSEEVFTPHNASLDQSKLICLAIHV